MRRLLSFITCFVVLTSVGIAADDAMTHYLAGEYYEYLGLFDEAESEYQQALSMYTSSGDSDWVARTQDALDRLDKISLSKSEDMIHTSWEFKSEIQEEDVVTQFFHTEDLELVSVARVPTELLKGDAYDTIYEMLAQDTDVMDDLGVDYVSGNTGATDMKYYYYVEKGYSTVVKAAWYTEPTSSIYVLYANIKKSNRQSFLETLNYLEPVTPFSMDLTIILVIAVVCIVGFAAFKFTQSKDKKVGSLFASTSKKLKNKRRKKKKSLF